MRNALAFLTFMACVAILGAYVTSSPPAMAIRLAAQLAMVAFLPWSILQLLGKGSNAH